MSVSKVFSALRVSRPLRVLSVASLPLLVSTAALAASAEPPEAPAAPIGAAEATPTAPAPVDTSATPEPAAPTDASRTEAAPSEAAAVSLPAAPPVVAPTAGEPAIAPPDGASENGKDGSEQQPENAADGPFGTITVGGRVFAAARLMTREQTLVNSEGMLETRTLRSLDLSIPSARVKVEYQSAFDWLSAEIEAEFAGRPELKDGFVQARNKSLWFRAGQFKMPISVITMESPWRLPIAHRGLIHDLVNDVLMVGGRAPGLAGRVRVKGGVRPELTLGAFQGSLLVDPSTNDTELAEGRFLPSQHFVARAGVRLGDLDVAASYQHRMGTRVPFERETHWTAGADAHLDLEFSNGGVRAWIEGLAGESWIEHESKPADDELTTFVLARAIVAPRFGGLEDRARYLEPFVGASMLEPDAGGVVNDLAWEFVAGVNVGYWQLVRVGLQGELVRADRNFPAAYLLGENPDRQAILAQLGINF